MDGIRKQVLKEVIIGRPYVFYFILVFLLYFGANAWINQTYVGATEIFSTYKLSFLIPFLTLLFLVPALVALNVNLSIYRIKELGNMGKRGSVGTGSLGTLGIFTGVLGGACPGCLAGLFPAVLGIFGAASSLSILPFNGLEIQVLSVGLLLIGSYYLTRPITCRI